MNNYCVYTHTSPSGKVYVGQSNNPKRRWGYNGEHYMNKKKDGSYVQAAFARAIIKYGWDAFLHEIILDNISKNEADYTEKYLIKWYKLHEISYNITDGGEGCKGVRKPLSEERKQAIREFMQNHPPMKGKHHTLEAKAKISLASKNRNYTQEQKEAIAEKRRLNGLGRKHSDETKKKLSEYRKNHPELWIGGWNKKEVHQYDLNGSYIASYSSATEAAQVNSISESSILNCANGKIASANRFIWSFVRVNKVDTSNYKIVWTKKGARLYDVTEEGKRKRRNGHGRPVNQYSLDGKYIKTYPSVTDAKEAVNYFGGGITRCCLHKPKYKTAAGYIWEYDVGSNRKDKGKGEADCSNKS